MARKPKSPASTTQDAAAAVDGYLDMLGTVPDSEIAAMANVSEAVVAQVREGRGVPAHVPHPLMRYRHMFGNVADEVIAAEAGVSRGTIGNFRRQMGLPSYRGHLDAQKGVKRAKVEAVVEPVVEAAPAPAPAKAAKAAKAAKVVEAPAPAPVKATKAAKAAKAEPGGAAPRRSKLDAHAHLIGVLRDSAVAKIAGMTSESVRLYRMRTGQEAGKLLALEEAAPAKAKKAAPAAKAAKAPKAPAAAARRSSTITGSTTIRTIT